MRRCRILEWAFDTVTKQDVNAINAIRAANRYTCSVCGAECSLRKGLVIRPYFAHNDGVASEVCENYHPNHEIIKTIKIVACNPKRTSR